jgi:FKBP-type peptidyl-prolyl cis-trans isomerase
MPRRSKRQSEDNDDSLERAYLSKRTKKYDDDEPRIEATRKKATTATIATPGDATTTTSTDAKKDANDKIERQRQKKLLRKEQNKAKTQGRKMEEQVRDQEQRELAAALEAKRQQQRERKQKIAEAKKKIAESPALPAGALVSCRKGVQYQDIVIGAGRELRKGKQIQVKYKLRAKPGDKGRLIDSSHNFGTKLGRGEVIDGWDIGLQGMKQGGVRLLIVPPQAGYGNKDIGAGPNAMLYFEIELLFC